MSRSSKCVCINFTWLLVHLSFAMRRICYVASSARIRRYMERTWKHTAYIQVQLILVKPSRVTNDLCVLVSQSCLTLCDLMAYSPPGSFVHRIFQARILEWVDIFLLQGIFPTQELNLHLLQVGFFTTEPPGKLSEIIIQFNFILRTFPCFYNGLLYVLGACHLETVSAREVSIVAKTAYCLSSVLSSFHIMKFCLTRGNNDHEKMHTSQPALQIRMAVDWIGFLGNLLNMSWFGEEVSTSFIHCPIQLLATWSVDMLAGAAAVIFEYEAPWGWKVGSKNIRGGLHGTYVCLTV